MDNQAKTMYLLGVVLFLLTGIGFAIQGDLLAGGVFLVLFFALYMLIVFLHHRSLRTRKLATFLMFAFGVIAAAGAVFAYTQGGYLWH
ncbi:hypothetical protein [Shouchella clausii]|uniref:hypothetical protein n=1 Tax=Shouchella clausii TaxID=79880 RepID=UPI000BA7E1EE|nr:hypothetical protein [Shouchella clausii]MDO7268178.1 hypothetical protein [Shouchella clausii]MDO7288058.1 hypothetical protein [Shouchella clausii]PAD19608.1 hypothetical protein CHH73_00050 [Shouchella clausii]PAF10903.1 hypothetical protein CHH65_03345 [Shouchella clausii]GIN17588.1 hypothetical protein J32TS2_29440 [Shouchella clausii]